jgi:GMC oxidoreductase
VRPTLWSEEDAGAHNADAELAGAGDGEYEGLSARAAVACHDRSRAAGECRHIDRRSSSNVTPRIFMPNPMGGGPRELQVHGVDGLRDADASVMPTVVRGNANGSQIAIAEKTELSVWAYA